MDITSRERGHDYNKDKPDKGKLEASGHRRVVIQFGFTKYIHNVNSFDCSVNHPP
jgi:hypothetical protein